MEPGELIPVTLSATEWNQVLAVLGEGPFRVVAPLITKIHGQALKANGSAAPALAGAMLTPRAEPGGPPLVQN
jgi:hypothetical protein